MNSEFFITFEGGEGVGKTTQIKHLETYLKSIGHDVLLTREPGGTKSAEAIRDLIFHPDFDGNWTVSAETLMMFAARSMHIKDVIQPALKEGKIVLCDRYIDSTTVYQGQVKGDDLNLIKTLQDKIIGDVMPDITVILDLPAEAAMKRVQNRGVENNNDKGPLKFYENLRQGFLNIAQNDPNRCIVINADTDEKNIASQITNHISERLS